jgi:hypothetical protein
MTLLPELVPWPERQAALAAAGGSWVLGSSRAAVPPRCRRRAVMMLQHHTRNTEQKQWDETLTLALNGMNKVLRAHLAPFMALQVRALAAALLQPGPRVCAPGCPAALLAWRAVAGLGGSTPPAPGLASSTAAGLARRPASPAARPPGGRSAPAHTQPPPAPPPPPPQDFVVSWESLMGICALAMASGRKTIAIAATGLITNSLQAAAPPGPVQQWMWKRAMLALHAGVAAMGQPSSQAPIQARLEILNGVTGGWAGQGL